MIAAVLALPNRPKIILSLAGLHQPNRAIPDTVQQRTGGFGGIEGLNQFIRAESIDRIIDATHPFAATMARNAAQSAKECQVPLIKLLRPATPIPPALMVIRVPSLIAASQLANGHSSATMVALGRRGCDEFLTATSLPASSIYQPLGLTDSTPLHQQLAESGAKILVLRDSGGDRSAEWLVAARDLGCTVLLIDPPPPPAVTVVPSVTEVMAWLANPPPQSV